MCITDDSFETPRPQRRMTSSAKVDSPSGIDPLVTPSSAAHGHEVYSPAFGLETPVSCSRVAQDRTGTRAMFQKPEDPQLAMSPSFSLATPVSVTRHTNLLAPTQVTSISPHAQGVSAEQHTYEASATPTPLPRSLRASSLGSRATANREYSVYALFSSTLFPLLGRARLPLLLSLEMKFGLLYSFHPFLAFFVALNHFSHAAHT
jgi:hypothetical protein